MIACEWSLWKFWKGDNFEPPGGADLGSLDEVRKGDTENNKKKIIKLTLY